MVPPAAEEVDRSAILKIARRRAERPEGGTAGAAPAPEPATTEGVLYSKGAATASNFKPWYWSYDHKDEGAPGESEAVVTRIPTRWRRRASRPLRRLRCRSPAPY